MQVSLETVGPLGRRMTVAVPAEQIEQVYTARLQRLSRQVRVPGFRPGKVPAKIIEAQYGERLLEEVAGDVIQSSLREALGKEGLRPAGGPRIEPKALKRGEEFRYTAEFEIYPELPAISLKGVRIERPRVVVADEDVARTLDTIRRQRTRYQPVARAARSGDRLMMDFVGRLNGEIFEGGAARNLPLVLGSQTLVEDFEQGLIGATAGEVRNVPVRFPGDYRHPKLAGQAVDFEVRVHEVSEPVVPEVNEALARELGVADGNLDDLRRQVRENLGREGDKRSRAVVRACVMKALLAAAPFDVPTALVDEELKRMRQQEPATNSLNPEARRERARSRVALGLILAEVMRRQGIRADAARVRARLEQMAEEYESPQEFIKWHYGEPGRLAAVEALVMEEQIVEELLKEADVVDQSVGFQDLLKIEETI